MGSKKFKEDISKKFKEDIKFIEHISKKYGEGIEEWFDTKKEFETLKKKWKEGKF